MYRPVTKDISHVEISLTRAMLSEIGNDSEMHLVKRNASPIDIYYVFSGKTEGTCHLVYSYWYSDNAIILLIYFLQKCNVLVSYFNNIWERLWQFLQENYFSADSVKQLAKNYAIELEKPVHIFQHTP